MNEINEPLSVLCSMFEEETIIRVVDIGESFVVSVCDNFGNIPFKMPYGVEKDGKVFEFDMRNEKLKDLYSKGKCIYEDYSLVKHKPDNVVS